MKTLAGDWIAFAIVVLLAAPAAAQNETPIPEPDSAATSATDSNARVWSSDEDMLGATATDGYPYLEWHGYGRFRTESFWNLDLDTGGTSPILPPIEALLEPGSGTAFSDSEIPETATDENLDEVDVTQYQNADAEHIGGANLRFRLSPIIHVTERARINLELNVLDNIVMGSTPDGFNELAVAEALSDSNVSRPDVPLAAFTQSSEPPNVFSAGRSSLTVTQAYAEINGFFGVVRAGRMAADWGLGIVENGAGSYHGRSVERSSYRGMAAGGFRCTDCDFGDYVDRLEVNARVMETYFTASWDYSYAGPTAYTPLEYYGQIRDLTQRDDARTLAIAVSRRPLTDSEWRLREQALVDQRVPVLDWGVRYRWRRQKLSADNIAAYSVADGGDVLPYQNTWWVRSLRLHMPDAWARFVSEPAPGRRIRLEFEAAAVIGRMQNAANDAQYEPYRQRFVRQYAAALEFDYEQDQWTTGLNTGLASGRRIDTDAETPVVGFGVIDQFALNDAEPEFNSFQFDRNYFVDMIMFREIIGTITNAFYANPFVEYEVFATDTTSLSTRLDLVTGYALQPDTTPSGRAPYGTEFDLTVMLRMQGVLAQIAGGLYVPGAAFDGQTGRPRLNAVGAALGQPVPYRENVAAQPAWTLQTHLVWAF